MKDPELLEAVWSAALCQICEFNPQCLVSSSWAFATLAVRDSALLEALRRSSGRRFKMVMHLGTRSEG